MTRQIPTPPTSSNEKGRVTLSRLLLAKQMYLHGLEHSQKTGETDLDINHMIAVHDLHNAVEIVLRTIIFYYDLQEELGGLIGKKRYVGFYDIFGKIDKLPTFKKQNITLPYRENIDDLNNLRNLAQHSSYNPANSEIWQVFTHLFLKKVYRIYFGVDLDTLSLLKLVKDDGLKALLSLSLERIRTSRFDESLALSSFALELSIDSVFDIPDENESTALDSALFGSGFDDLLDKEDISWNVFYSGFRRLQRQVNRAEAYAILSSSGVNLVDYQKFTRLTPSMYGCSENSIKFRWTQGAEKHSDETAARYAHEFATEIIVNWQILGLTPSVPKQIHAVQVHDAVDKVISGEASIDFL